MLKRSEKLMILFETFLKNQTDNIKKADIPNNGFILQENL